jgi:DNA-binding NtrC family response regulator
VEKLDFDFGIERTNQDGEPPPAEFAISDSFEATMGGVTADTFRWSAGETLLLVEDEALVRQAMGEALESAGYRVIITEEATQALQAYHARSGSVDLLLSDVVLPGISGYQLAQILQEVCPQLPVLLVSGYLEPSALCETSPFRREYLAKPFSIATLLHRIREVLNRNPLDIAQPPPNSRLPCGSA